MIFMPRKGRNIYKRKDGRWEARVYFSGSKKYRSVYAKTYKEALEKQNKLRMEIGTAGKNDYLVTVLAERWLSEKRFVVKEGTAYSYDTKLKKHILPYFSGVYVSKLNISMLSGFVAAKRAEGMSEKYISDMVVIIKSVSAWANVRYDIPDRISKFKNLKITAKEPLMLNAAEQKKLQQHLLRHNDSISLGIFTGMFTGMRIGEICALRWSDIDLENGVISINKSVQRLPGGADGKTEVKICIPKTATSVRVIPIPRFLADILEQRKQNGDCFLLSNSDRPIEPRTLTHKFKKILAAAGVSEVKFHSLRHAFATNCLQNNFDIKTLSEILGHASPNITLKIYLHSSMEQKRICMDRLTPL